MTVTVHAAGDSSASQKAPGGEAAKDTASEGAAAAKNAASDGAAAAKNAASNGAGAAKDAASEGAKLASKAGVHLLAAKARLCEVSATVAWLNAMVSRILTFTLLLCFNVLGTNRGPTDRVQHVKSAK